MSSDSQTLQRDYIRLTERFKALSTFDHFLQGIHRAFLPVRSGPAADLEPLFNELKRLSGSGRSGSDGDRPTASTLRELEAKLDAAAAQLRTADISLSPSLTRRYFEKVRPSDPRIPFYLLRFYASSFANRRGHAGQGRLPRDGAGRGNARSRGAPPRPRAEVRKLFDAVLMGSAWPRIDDDTAAEIARAFDELAAQIASASGFGNLAEEGWIESLRNFKRQVSRGLAHPEILTAVGPVQPDGPRSPSAASTRERSASSGERRTGSEASNADPPPARLEDVTALRVFEESRREFERQVSEGSVRWRQLLEARQAASEALKMLGLPEPGADEEARSDTEAALGGLEDPFWGPCLRRVLSTLGDGGAVSVEGLRVLTQWNLETWETEAARRLIGGQEPLEGGPRGPLRRGAADQGGGGDGIDPEIRRLSDPGRSAAGGARDARPRSGARPRVRLARRRRPIRRRIGRAGALLDANADAPASRDLGPLARARRKLARCNALSKVQGPKSKVQRRTLTLGTGTWASVPGAGTPV